MGRRVNLNTVLDFLKTLDVKKQTDEERRIGREFVRIWPQQAEVLNEFRQHPNCGSCRQTLLELLSGEPAKVGKLLRQINPKEEWQLDPTANRPLGTHHRPRQPVESNSLTGQCFDLPDTVEAYKEFMERQKRLGARFNGLSVRSLASGMVRLYFF